MSATITGADVTFGTESVRVRESRFVSNGEEEHGIASVQREIGARRDRVRVADGRA